jgi:glycine/D-amino acid oxidase-like deaminating enzyme
VTSPARGEYRTVIVGAGIIGLYTAYHLARAGHGPILIVDRGFLSSGASGRNGGGVRQQWDTPATIALAREAVAAYRRFGTDFGYNVWFRQGGYLFLAEDAGELAPLGPADRRGRGARRSGRHPGRDRPHRAGARPGARGRRDVPRHRRHALPLPGGLGAL